MQQGQISKQDIVDHLDDDHPGEYSDLERTRMADVFYECLFFEELDT